MTERHVTVLGVGNPIMGDDGIGLELLARLGARRTDPRIEYLDGGTAGMELIPVVQDASRLLILDAVASTLPPGTPLRLGGDQLPRLLASRLSPHQVSLLDVLTAARLLGTEPDAVEVVGVVPAVVELRLGLTPAVAAGLDAAVDLADQVLGSWLA